MNKINKKALPCTTTDTDTTNKKHETLEVDGTTNKKHETLEVDGETITLDNLGPMIINTDGTISRITNFFELTDFERERTLRLVAKR